MTSASGANGDGFGALLAFAADGQCRGALSDDLRIADPRGMCTSADGKLLYLNSGDDRILALDSDGQVVLDSGRIPGLNAGGGVVGPDGRYYVGLRSEKTIAAFSPDMNGPPVRVLPPDIVPFPRGFGFAADGRLFLASGIGPDGAGQNTILAFGPGPSLTATSFIDDDEVSPLDLAVAPGGNVLVSSEYPFGAPNAVASIREYDGTSGELVRVFSPPHDVPLHRPRGLRFGPGGVLYCVARDAAVAFDYASGRFIGTVVSRSRLNGQAITFFGPLAIERRIGGGPKIPR